MSSPHVPNQEAWQRFALRLLLILDAMLADLSLHIAAECGGLPAWHPMRLALPRLATQLTRLRAAIAALPETAGAVPARADSPRPAALQVQPAIRPAIHLRPTQPVRRAPWHGRCTTRRAAPAARWAALSHVYMVTIS